MQESLDNITRVNIEDELKQSYMGYAMSVIIGRALPDVRDGLKPVHRRLLYAMKELGNDFNKPYKKSARIVGDVIGKYHPHGDSSVYDAIVRMAQDFSMRYILVDGQGNFGSVDGDPPAAMRYTEVRMAKIAHSLLADLEKETVDFIPNYDESEMQPTVLPTRVPNLLVNGSSGIAVGMATNIPPHNLSEVIAASLHLLENPDSSVDALMQHVPGPDFPTYGFINGRSGIVSAYRTGKGRVIMRAKAEVIALKSNKEAIIVHELPYQVNKARLIERIADLVKDKKVEGISEIRDESDKQGMRIVIEIKRGESGEVILNQLYAQTQLQSTFGMNMVALVDGQPRLLTLKDFIAHFLLHRQTVVTRRTVYDLSKAKVRAHILEGLAVALANLDPVIQTIKSSQDPKTAKEKLQATLWAMGDVAGMLERASGQTVPDGMPAAGYGKQPEGQYRLSPEQAHAILELKLHRLTGLEQDKILEEYQTILVAIAEFLDILSNPDRLKAVIKEELTDILDTFGDARRTVILESELDLSDEDLIAQEDRVVTLSHAGYAKAQPLADYQAQRRGGKGKIATKMKEEDFVEKLMIANTHDTILCFSSKGKVYWLKVHQLPVASRTSKGRPIVNLLPLESDEKIQAILPIQSYSEGLTVFMATQKGTVKRVALSQFARPRNSGIIAMDLDADDRLIGVELAAEDADAMLFTSAGKAIRFSVNTVRVMGRTARGVRGIKLKSEQTVIGLVVLDAEHQDSGMILTATQNGYGKRTQISEYSRIGRGGQGVISIQTSERNGAVVGAVFVQENDQMMLISDQGTMVRTRVDEVSCVGRNTQGVRLINLAQEEHLVGLERVLEAEDDTDVQGEGDPDTEVGEAAESQAGEG